MRERIAVLALQGAFLEHEQALERLDTDWCEIRQAKDLEQAFDGLILPGGESTVQGKLLRELGLFHALKKRIEDGMPVMATCAGLILLAEHLVDDPTVWFGTLPVAVSTNAYRRQQGSFFTRGAFGDIADCPMTFIRAPFVESCRPDVEVLSRFDGQITAVRWQNQLAMAFHPELDQDMRIHRNFLEMVRHPASCLCWS